MQALHAYFLLEVPAALRAVHHTRLLEPLQQALEVLKVDAPQPIAIGEDLDELHLHGARPPAPQQAAVPREVLREQQPILQHVVVLRELHQRLRWVRDAVTCTHTHI